MPAVQTSFDGNPFLGLFARASDKWALMPVQAAQKFEDAVKKLGVEPIKTSVSSSPYIGLYCTGNSNGIVLAPFCTPREIEAFEQTEAQVKILEGTKFSAVGNNIVCNDRGAVVNAQMGRTEIKKIEDALGVEAVALSICGYHPIGMMVAASNKGFLVHNRISEEELKQLEDALKVKGMNGTINSGTPMVGLGICANSKSALVGESTTGFEMGRVEQALELTD